MVGDHPMRGDGHPPSHLLLGDGGVELDGLGEEPVRAGLDGPQVGGGRRGGGGGVGAGAGVRAVTPSLLTHLLAPLKGAGFKVG
jgi:hypothetical protein